MHIVVIHHAEIAVAQRLRHRLGHFRLRLDDQSAHLLRLRLHLLLERDRHRTALFRLRLGDALVRFRLIHLQLRADVTPYVDVGDVDGQDLERGAVVKPLVEDGLGDLIGVFEHVFVALRRTDGRDDALADTRDDRVLTRAADEARDVRPDGHARFDAQFDAVFRDRRNGRRLDDLGVDRHLDRVEHVAAGKVDRPRRLRLQLDVGAVRADQSVDDLDRVALGENVRFELVDRDVESRL